MIKISKSEIQKAMRKAKTENWQAKNLEILLIPKVKNQWHRLNRDHFVEDHSVYRSGGGYYFALWNDPRWDTSPVTTWDGVRRLTVSLFIEFLRYWASGVQINDYAVKIINEAGFDLT